METENQGEYLGIKDFAKLAGVSPQAVYLRMKSKKNQKIMQYVKTEDDRTVISVKAAELFAKDPEKEENKACLNLDETLIKSLQSQIDMLSAELDSKNTQISELHRLLHMEQQMNQDARAALDAAREKQLLLETKVVELESAEQQQEETKEEAQEPQHRPWFYKIFGR